MNSRKWAILVTSKWAIKMPKKKDKIPETFRTIYIITNADKTILSAFTSEEEAKKEIDFKY